MRRWFAAAAIVLGAVGVVPVVDLFINPPEIMKDGPEPSLSPVMRVATGLYYIFGAPILLLWGLINIHDTEGWRIGVFTGALVLCLCTLPFGLGLILVSPLLFCMLRGFKAERS